MCGLLDTSAVLVLSRLLEPSQLPDRPRIYAATLAEPSVGPLVAQSYVERSARQAHHQQAENDFDAIPFDAAAAGVFGRVAASLRRVSRKSTARSYDAISAAIAIAHDLPSFTCNPADFQGIDGVVVVPVPHPNWNRS